MKASVILTALVISAAVWFGRSAHERVDAARQRHEVLERQATGLGLPDDSTPSSGKSRLVRETARDPKTLVAALNAAPGPGDMKKICGDLSLLDEKGMEAFAREMVSSPDMSDGQRAQMLNILMDTALSERPETVMVLLDKFVEAGGKPHPGVARQLAPPALARWAARNPSAALEWMKTRGNRYPEYVTDAAKCGALSSVAADDPARAFREISALGIVEAQNAICSIARAGETPRQHLSVLAELRRHLATLPDERVKNESWRAAIASLAASTVSGGEASARQWIASAGFTPVEADAFAAGIAKSALRSPEQTGRWITFLVDAGGEKFPTQPVREMMETWTKDDYLAAGQWLTTAPEGRAKQTTVRAYAETVAKYDPATAEQWALTLPAGKGRAATLAKILGQWPEDDVEGKAAFAERHGIR